MSTKSEILAEAIERQEDQCEYRNVPHGWLVALIRAYIEPMERELAVARATIARLNRRCQAAESAARQNVEDCRRAGVPLGRVLAAFSCRRLEEERDDARAELAVAQARIRELESGSKGGAE